MDNAQIRLTIFTPTYNRENLLTRLYESLCLQTDKNFLWLVVDDGSTDSTRAVIDKWQQQNDIKIQYHYQENGGKHVAHNTAVMLCQTPYCVCVDSDDWLPENAIEIINQNIAVLDKRADEAGLMAWKKTGDNCNLDVIISQTQACSIAELYRKYKYRGETVLVFKTAIIKQYPFPVFEGEKFVTESVVYDRISRHYKMMLVNTCLTYAEYQTDGYSHNIRLVHKKNPRGYIYHLTQHLTLAETFNERYRASVVYLAGCASIGKWRECVKARWTPYFIISFPAAAIAYAKIMLKPVFQRNRFLRKFLRA